MDTPLTNISGSWTVIQRTIKTDFWAKPIPIRSFDWEAWIDETADEGMLIGYGATKAAAIQNLLEQEQEVD